MKFRADVVPQWPSSRGLMCWVCQRLLEQRIVVEINLAYRQVIRAPANRRSSCPAIPQTTARSFNLLERSIDLKTTDCQREVIIGSERGLGTSGREYA